MSRVGRLTAVLPHLTPRDGESWRGGTESHSVIYWEEASLKHFLRRLLDADCVGAESKCTLGALTPISPTPSYFALCSTFTN